MAVYVDGVLHIPKGAVVVNSLEEVPPELMKYVCMLPRKPNKIKKISGKAAVQKLSSEVDNSCVISPKKVTNLNPRAAARQAIRQARRQEIQNGVDQTTSPVGGRQSSGLVQPDVVPKPFSSKFHTDTRTVSPVDNSVLRQRYTNFRDLPRQQSPVTVDIRYHGYPDVVHRQKTRSHTPEMRREEFTAPRRRPYSAEIQLTVGQYCSLNRNNPVPSPVRTPIVEQRSDIHQAPVQPVIPEPDSRDSTESPQPDHMSIASTDTESESYLSRCEASDESDEDSDNHSERWFFVMGDSSDKGSTEVSDDDDDDDDNNDDDDDNNEDDDGDDTESRMSRSELASELVDIRHYDLLHDSSSDDDTDKASDSEENSDDDDLRSETSEQWMYIHGDDSQKKLREFGGGKRLDDGVELSQGGEQTVTYDEGDVKIVARKQNLCRLLQTSGDRSKVAISQTEAVGRKTDGTVASELSVDQLSAAEFQGLLYKVKGRDRRSFIMEPDTDNIYKPNNLTETKTAKTEENIPKA